MDGRELKQYEKWKEEVQFLRGENQHLRRELDTYRPSWYRASVRIDELEQRVKKLTAENKLLKQQLKERTPTSQQPPESEGFPPAILVKPSVSTRRRKRPGRKKGHPGALRPLPDHIDVHTDVALPKDPDGRESCPRCLAPSRIRCSALPAGSTGILRSS